MAILTLKCLATSGSDHVGSSRATRQSWGEQLAAGPPPKDQPTRPMLVCLDKQQGPIVALVLHASHFSSLRIVKPRWSFGGLAKPC